MANIFQHIFNELNDVNDVVPNGTPKILIPSNGVLKLSGRPKVDHATHFWSSVWKCSYANDTFEKMTMI